jgi:hypothetical protein
VRQVEIGLYSSEHVIGMRTVELREPLGSTRCAKEMF